MNEFITQISKEEIRLTFLQNDKNISWRLQDLYIDYLKAYFNNSRFEDLSFKINFSDNLVIFPITLEIRNENEKFLNYYGDYIDFFYKKIPKAEEQEVIYNYFDYLINKYQVKNLKIKIKQIDYKFNREPLYTTELDSVLKQININLNLSLEEILNNFTSGLRNVLKKDYPVLHYEVRDKNNYTEGDMSRMQKLHLEVSGYKTRSDLTWLINERMILDNLGFLVRVKAYDKIISYNFFIHDKITCSHHSSCTYREFFKEYRNITYKSLFLAMKYLKNANKCNNFFIGYKTIFSTKQLSQKEKDIEFFKERFSKKGDIYYCYSNLKKNIFKFN